MPVYPGHTDTILLFTQWFKCVCENSHISIHVHNHAESKVNTIFCQWPRAQTHQQPQEARTPLPMDPMAIALGWRTRAMMDIYSWQATPCTISMCIKHDDCISLSIVGRLYPLQTKFWVVYWNQLVVFRSGGRLQISSPGHFLCR